jgi:hypothetical protein
LGPFKLIFPYSVDFDEPLLPLVYNGLSSSDVDELALVILLLLGPDEIEAPKRISTTSVKGVSLARQEETKICIIVASVGASSDGERNASLSIS